MTGKHYWEVEIIGAKLSHLYLGVCMSNATHPSLVHYKAQCSTTWLMHVRTSCLHGNGKCGDNKAGCLTQGNRLGILVNLDDGSLLFFKDGMQHGPGYPVGSVKGPVALAVRMFDKGSTVRLLPDVPWPAGHAP